LKGIESLIPAFFAFIFFPQFRLFPIFVPPPDLLIHPLFTGLVAAFLWESCGNILLND
jgi:hypothetical protein